MAAGRSAPLEYFSLSAEKTAPVADDWVQRMIDSPGRSGQLKTGDHTTHYLEWGDASNSRVMLLLHGFLGHAHWWDFVAPWFASEYRVIAIDFGGMGDSAPQPKYSNASFVGEVGAMLEMTGSNAVTLVGHSFGGRVAVLAAHRYPQYLKRAIVVDSKIGFSNRPVRPPTPRVKQRYPDLETACSRFRLVPDEPPLLPRIMRHLAEHSLKRERDAYVWKFDEALMGGVAWQEIYEGELFAQIKVPVDFICGEFSLVVPNDLAVRIGAALRHGRGPIVIPSAYHHVPVDQPLALAATLRALLL
jgi:pimeloyl-ACP methyl ester carboxylesterase